MNNALHITSKQNWFVKYKLYHLAFWFLYHFLWWWGYMGDPLQVFSTILNTKYSIKFIFPVIFQALAVYFNLYFLIPKFLEKNRLIEYLVCLALTVTCATSCIASGYYLIAFIAESNIQELFGAGSFIYLFINYALASTLASTTLAMSIKLTKNWFDSKRRQQLLEKEKIETELKFLKYQFNPHFLFNTINSIFFLIHKNPDMASDSLAKFSELLRYQLYECNDKQIPLNNEIDYLENFIELEKLRQNDYIKVTMNHHQQSACHLGIAPFILMTFVENAFKHVSKDADKLNWINIQSHLDHQLLDFRISNSKSDIVAQDVVNFGGIGLQNVKRRLDLLYAGQYELDIKNHTSSFEINLRLQLSELVMPSIVQNQTKKSLEPQKVKARAV